MICGAVDVKKEEPKQLIPRLLYSEGDSVSGTSSHYLLLTLILDEYD
jgi:hypothetical protein